MLGNLPSTGLQAWQVITCQLLFHRGQPAAHVTLGPTLTSKVLPVLGPEQRGVLGRGVKLKVWGSHSLGGAAQGGLSLLLLPALSPTSRTSS